MLCRAKLDVYAGSLSTFNQFRSGHQKSSTTKITRTMFAVFAILTFLLTVPDRQGMLFAQTANGSLNVLTTGAKCDGITDDTAAIQAVINRARNSVRGATIVIPQGMNGCVVSQLDITNSQSHIRLVGGASMNGGQSTIICREAQPDTAVCIDFSGTDSFNVENLQILGGATPGTAPRVTVLLGKAMKGGAVGNGSEITWSSVTITANGDYGVYNYGGEVWNCDQCYFVGPTLADVVLSAANTAGITSAFASLLPPPVSMTCVHFNGGTFGTNSSAIALLLDPWPNQGAGPISDVSLSDGYAHLAGPAFIADTGTSPDEAIIQGLRVTGWRTEAYSPTTRFAIFNSVVFQLTIDASYAPASPPAAVPPLQFNGAWGPYSLIAADIKLRPADWNTGYPPVTVACRESGKGVVIHDFVNPNGTSTGNNCPGATQM